MSIDYTFTDADRALILHVKDKIQQHIDVMVQQPWMKSLHTLNWDKVYLTGGAIASLLQGETPKDWDFYCEDDMTMRRIKHDLLKDTQYIKDVTENYKEKYGLDGKMITAQAITMTDDSSFITMITDYPGAMKKTFDYVHCTPHFHMTTQKLYISPFQFKCAKEKKLVVNNYKNIKEWRTQKFLDRGYTTI